MKTLSPKVLPQVRILLQACREQENQVLNLESGEHKLSVLKRKFRHEHFDFFTVTDGQYVSFTIAVLRENHDSIIPYKYYHDIDGVHFRYADFLADGTINFTHVQSLYQEEFCRHCEKFFQYANMYFEILPR